MVMNIRGSVIAVLSVAALASGDAQDRSQDIPGARLSIAAQRGRLTASLDQAPLLAVLDELSRQTRIAITPAEGLDLEVVSAELKNIAVDEGVRKLLENYDAFLYYTPDRRRQATLTAVWVYPKGAAATLRPVPPELWASARDLESALSDRDPAVRERAYDALMSRPDRASHNLVVLAIQGASEPDVELRERLLSAAISKAIELPRDVLADLVRADAAETIRLMALDALSGDPAAREIGAAALADASLLVRERAKEFLAELDSMSGREPSIR
jgi:hypothetical protein